MKAWNTSDIRELLSDDRWEIESQEPGGDVDSETLILRAAEAGDADYLEGEEDARVFLSVAGFRTEGEIGDPSDCEVEMVEVTDGLTSEGGLTTDDHATCLMYGEIVSRLRKDGFTVVPYMKDYF